MEPVFRGLLKLIKFGLRFTSASDCSEKINRIPSAEQKNLGFDLQGWEYHALASPSSGDPHHYYRCPPPKRNAPVFLFFHGLNLDGRTFLNLSGLAEHWELIAYDLPEKTDRYQGRFDDFMTLVDEFISLMKISSCSVCGVSFGGAIALSLASHHPSLQVQQLALISTGLFNISEQERLRNRRIADWVQSLTDSQLYWLVEKIHWLYTHRFARGSLGSAEKILSVKQPSFYRQVFGALSDFNGARYVADIRCPVLVLSGDRDRFFSRGQVEAIKQHIPDARLHLIKGGTHSMVFTQGEEISRRIRAFCHPAAQTLTNRN
jgi:pimeloyl-ACP methyl ester carboxylesterase